MEPHEADGVLIKTVGLTVSKVSLYVCATIAMGMIISTCKIDEAVIVQCEESCGAIGIKEVTSTSCECNEPLDDVSSPFVIPSR